MGDEQGGEAGGTLADDAEDVLFVFEIEAIGGFVEDEECGFEEEGAGEGDALTLAVREHDAAIADDGVYAICERVDELRAGLFDGLGEVFVGGGGAGPKEVFADGVVEEQGVLADVADVATPTAGIVAGEGDAVGFDSAGLGEEEAHDEVGDSAFAYAGGACDGGDAAGGEGEVD